MMATINPSLDGVEQDRSRILRDLEGRMLSGWFPVVYDLAAQTVQAKAALTSIADAAQRTNHQDRLAEALLVRAVLTMKHPGFAAEKEWRYLVLGPDEMTEVSYRVRGSRVIPYVLLTGSPATGDQKARGEVSEVAKPSNLPVDRLRLGPAVDATTAAALRKMLGSMGYWRVSMEGVEGTDVSLRL